MLVDANVTVHLAVHGVDRIWLNLILLIARIIFPIW